jgi:hypothetical protein
MQTIRRALTLILALAFTVVLLAVSLILDNLILGNLLEIKGYLLPLSRKHRLSDSSRLTASGLDITFNIC